MFGRKRPTIDEKPNEKISESDRTTSYRVDQDAAPPTTGISKTTSYVNAMQFNGRGFETLN
jgi:hypothetical protein